MVLRCTRVHDAPLDAEQRAQARVLRLPYDQRVKSRLAAVCEDGTAVAVLLPRGSVLRDGTVLMSEDNVFVVVHAAAQPLTRVTADSALQLLRAVYHLANRHVAAQLAPDRALIERDPVLEEMLRALGAQVEHVEAPFDPESGAYEAHEHGHRLGHGHAHRAEIDAVSATVGEQLSIEAHQRRQRPQ